MWYVDNRTRFAADGAVLRDRRGAEVWLVVVKCTFDIRADGATEVAAEQPPVLLLPEYYGEPAKSSIKFDADLVLTKATTDVTVLGHAYAPGGRPVPSLDVGFRVGPVQKLLRVIGDRSWGVTGPSSPQPFLKMPLTYERSFGGIDPSTECPDRDFEWRNPVGTGFAVSSQSFRRAILPNIEYADQPCRSWKDHPRPAGFGPIDMHWKDRALFAGTYDEKWEKERQPLVPEDFDDRFYQGAPADQQAPEFLRGGEEVVLSGLTPGGHLSFLLPKLFLAFETLFTDDTRVIHTDRRLHGVIIEPDYPRVALVWHSSLQCHSKIMKLDRTVVTLRRKLAAAAAG